MEIKKILKETGLEKLSIIWLIGGFPFILFYCYIYHLNNKENKTEKENNNRTC